MTTSEKQSEDIDRVLQKMDDLNAELELQTNYLATIKWFLLTVIVMLIPVLLFIGYLFLQIMSPFVSMYQYQQ